MHSEMLSQPHQHLSHYNQTVCELSVRQQNQQSLQFNALISVIPTRQQGPHAVLSNPTVAAVDTCQLQQPTISSDPLYCQIFTRQEPVFGTASVGPQGQLAGILDELEDSPSFDRTPVWGDTPFDSYLARATFRPLTDTMLGDAGGSTNGSVSCRQPSAEK